MQNLEWSKKTGNADRQVIFFTKFAEKNKQIEENFICCAKKKKKLKPENISKMEQGS